MSILRLALIVLVIFAATVVTVPPGFSASADAPSPTNNADYDLGADAIKAQDWDRAVHHLAIAARAEPANADVQNLLGYAFRNQRKFELAFTHYGNALKLDPNHRGAHEYIGEAYVLTGNRAKAQEHLAALERICGRNCEEYQDLARALAKARP
jgi:Flp pilus assembly protein TadD